MVDFRPVPPFANYKKRRPAHGPTKNELKVSRAASAVQQKSRAGTLRERFPRVTALELDLRLETPMGVTLEEIHRKIGPDETLLLDVPCQGACGNGVFLLKDAVEALLEASQEHR